MKVIRQILGRLDEIGWTRYQLAVAVGMDPSSIYRMLDPYEGSIPFRWLEPILDALDLEITVRQPVAA